MQNPKVIQPAIRHWCAFLKDFRTGQNLTMDEVGRRMAILENRKEPYTRQYISYIESGDSSIGLDLFFRYCTAVGARPVLQLMNEQEFIHFSKNAKEKGLAEFDDWRRASYCGKLCG